MKSTHQINRFILIVFIATLVHVVLVASQDRNRQSTGGSLKDSSSNGWNSAEKTVEDSGSSENKGDDHDDDHEDDKDEDGEDEDEDDEDDDEDDDDGDDHYRVPPGHGHPIPVDAVTPRGVEIVTDMVDTSTRRHSEESHEIFLPSVDGSRPVEVEIAGKNTVSGQESETPQQSHVADGNFSAKHDEKTLFIAVGVAFSVVIVLAGVLLFVITVWRRRRQKSRSGASLTTARHESIEFETIPTCGTLDESAPVAPPRVRRDFAPSW